MNAGRRFLGSSALIPMILVAGCSYLGQAREFDPSVLNRESGWVAVRTVAPVRQEAEED